MSIPNICDWSDSGAVTPVRHQGQTNDCWAHAAVGNLEGQYFMETKQQSEPLSVKQIIDNEPKHQENNNNNGAGFAEWAFQYVKDEGIMTEQKYTDNGYDKEHVEKVIKMKSYMTTYDPDTLKPDGISPNEDEIASLLEEKGPLVAIIHAMIFDYSTDYNGSVITHETYMKVEKCSDDLHAVLIVGHGTNAEGMPFWKIKNSWGEKWGKKGYFFIEKGKGVLGIDQQVSTAVLTKERNATD